MWRFQEESLLNSNVQFDTFWRKQAVSSGMAFDSVAFDAFCRDLLFSSPLSQEKRQKMMEIERDAVSDLHQVVRARIVSSDPSTIHLYKGIANMAERTGSPLLFAISLTGARELYHEALNAFVLRDSETLLRLQPEMEDLIISLSKTFDQIADLTIENPESLDEAPLEHAAKQLAYLERQSKHLFLSNKTRLRHLGLLPAFELPTDQNWQDLFFDPVGEWEYENYLKLMEKINVTKTQISSATDFSSLIEARSLAGETDAQPYIFPALSESYLDFWRSEQPNTRIGHISINYSNGELILGVTTALTQSLLRQF